MTKREAIKAMMEGAKVQHRYFTPDEWVSSNPEGTFYTFEDGVSCGYTLMWQDRQGEQWETGWSIYSSN